jgi:vacuolar-type H+-ATPase subunit B/Vma2
MIEKEEPSMGAPLEYVGTGREKQLIQMSWLDITIKAVPPTGRCKPKGAITKTKIIIDCVSGTVCPGQFLAIIGASGKNHQNKILSPCPTSLSKCKFRRR